jgi:hypothetical protein
VGGGWSDDVVTFFVSFNLEVFPHGAERIDKTSRSEKSAAGQNVGWEGSTVCSIHNS